MLQAEDPPAAAAAAAADTRTPSDVPASGALLVSSALVAHTTPSCAPVHVCVSLATQQPVTVQTPCSVMHAAG
jgi:hypothetical protein